MVSPVEVVKPTDLVEYALRRMVERNVGCILIVDNERLLGIITERDISRSIIKAPENLKRSVDRMMSSPVIFLSPVAPISEAMETMLSYGIRRLPVVKAGKVVGIVTDRDLLRWVIKIANEPRIPAEIQEILERPLVSKMPLQNALA
jgi:CBS domain-containing protein